jgi:hypothetical protein
MVTKLPEYVRFGLIDTRLDYVYCCGSPSSTPELGCLPVVAHDGDGGVLGYCGMVVGGPWLPDKKIACQKCPEI